MKIIIDAMSGDNAPQAQVSGCVQAAKEFGQEYILVGQEAVLRDLLAKEQAENLPITIHDAQEIIDMHDDPATAVRRKKDASMSVALRMIKDGEADAMISAGNTGALLSGATLVTKRIRGIRRAALPTQLPCKGGHVLLIDSGANVECTEEYLLQFAFMGSFYMEKVMGVKNPRVGLVNNGAEDTKGDPLRKAAYDVLKAAGDAGRINFIGNVEGSDIPNGACDVAVTDGFYRQHFAQDGGRRGRLSDGYAQGCVPDQRTHQACVSARQAGDGRAQENDVLEGSRRRAVPRHFQAGI